MRVLLAVGACALVLGAPGAVSAQGQSGWTYEYTNGVATATERDERGRVTATISCQAPTGDIVLSDFTMARAARRATHSEVRIGAIAVMVPSRLEGRGRNRALMISLPQRPPILAAGQPTDQLSVTVNSQSRTLSEGGPQKMREVAYACWGS